MRVTHIITRLIVGGAQENTIASVLGLRKKPGLEAELISGPTSGPEGSLEHWVRGEPGLLRIEPHLVRPVSPVNDWRALRRLASTIAATRPDVVHTHSGKAGVLGRLAAARAGVPVVVHTVHGPSFGPFQGRCANLAFAAAERHAARVTTHFVVVADAMRDQYLAAGIGRPELYTTVRSGFDLSPYLNAGHTGALRRRLALDPADIVLGKIARLTALKGHDDLFAVAPELVRANSRLKFLLVGDGDLRPRFEAMAVASGLKGHFVFAGLVPPAEVPEYVRAMDFLVHLSSREGLPRALPQALAAGKPVVAYDCDGAREVCLPDRTGSLVRLGDRVQLKASLLRLADDPALRARWGEAGRAYVRERFSVETMVDALHALYVRLLEQRSCSDRREMAPALFC